MSGLFHTHLHTLEGMIDMVEKSRTVVAADGTRLAVTDSGNTDAPLALVLCHGLCLTQRSWEPQRHHLAHQWGDRLRIITYDHRGHGDSSVSDPTSLSITTLGDDLAAVITALVPHTPTVIVGHSMGGMAVLAFAARHREAMATVVGAGLISTAADQLAAHGVGRALRGPAVPLLSLTARRSPRAAQLAWSALRRGIAPLVGVPVPALPLQCAKQVSATPISTIAAFLQDFRTHDQRAGLAALAHLPTLVACGSADPITPVAHSLSLSEALPLSQLVTVPGAGHLLELERPRTVSDAVNDLLTRAASVRSHALVHGVA